VTAAFFAPFSCLPPALAYSLWLFANAAALLGGLVALFNTNLFPGFSQKCVGIVYLLLLPLGLGNLDVGQANPLVVGLLMFAIAAVRVKRWNIAALCVAIPTFLKIYPLAVGMLICVIAPRRFVWRLLLALLLLAVAPFLFQHWSYVRTSIMPGLKRASQTIESIIRKSMSRLISGFCSTGSADYLSSLGSTL
jgi:Glycosyltransferase family 87